MRNLESIFEGAERSSPNPFRDDVFAPGISSLPGVTEIHGEAMTRCIKALESLLTERGPAEAPWGGGGRVLLVAAPRAGYGKSHLVARVRAVTESLVAAVALPFDPARPVAWETILGAVFSQYRSARCPQHPSCTLFEEAARYFQSRLARAALERGAVSQGEVPETEIALRLQYREVFDPKAANRAAQWLARRAPELMEAVAGPLGQRWQMEFDDLVFWNRFFQDATRPRSASFEQLHALSGGAARDRVAQFLRIASDGRPLAFVADHLDGFFGSDSAGMRIAEILASLRQGVPRSVTLLCLNEDLWNSIFEGRVPSAWIDRLTGEAAPLGELGMEDAEALLRSRLREARWPAEEAEAWLGRHLDFCLETEGGPLYPRQVLRRAAQAWERNQARGEASPDARADRDRGGQPGGAPVSAAPDNVFRAASDPAGPAVASDSPQRRDQGIPAKPAAPPFTARAEGPAPGSPRPSTPGEKQPARPALPAHPVRLPQPGDLSAAARAAGIDPTKGLTNIDAIIAEIRDAGARALSETAVRAASGPLPAGRAQEPAAPGQEATAARPNPFWSRDLETRWSEIEAELRPGAGAPPLPWEPWRLERLIRATGSRFPAVAQAELAVCQRPCLAWSVRGASVLMGFEAPEHFAYWSEVLERARRGEAPGKAVLFSRASVPFDEEALAAMGTDPASAARHLDVIEIGEAELLALYAAERLMEECGGGPQGEGAVQIVARRLDGFWRRLGRPLASAAPSA